MVQDRFFAEIFTESGFVHIVRAGRAVANSVLQMPWWNGYRGPQHWLLGPLARVLQEEWDSSAESFVMPAALTWRVLMDSYESAVKTLPADRHLEIRYEDLLAQPEESMCRLRIHRPRLLQAIIRSRHEDSDRQFSWARI